MSQRVVRAGDFGFGRVKLTISGTGEGRTIGLSSFPSVTSILTRRPVANGGGVEQADVFHVPMGSGITYVCGKDVEATIDSRSSRTLDPAFPMSDSYLALARAAMAYMNASHIHTLVVGLPNTTLNTYRDSVVQRFTGKHTVYRPTGSHPEGCPITIQVDSVVCIAQPVGGYLDFAGSLTDQSQLANRQNLLIDVGYFTLDWVVARGMRVIDARSGAVEGGMSYCLSGMLEVVEGMLNKTINHPELIDSALCAGRDPEFYGKQIGMESLRPTGNARAESLLRKLVDKVGDAADISQVILSGGGAYFFKEVVQAKFPDHSVLVSPNAAFANVRGFQRFGEKISAGLSKRK